jgi:hypothetical protein
MAVTIVIRIPKVLGSNLCRDTGHHDRFVLVSSVHTANTWIIPPFGYNRFLRESFPIHLSSCHSTLCNLITDNVFMYFTKKGFS